VIHDQERLRRIRANADLAVEQLRAASGMEDFGFDAPSVKWVEGFIERQRGSDNATPDFIKNLSSVLGCYLGECIVRAYGGHWSDDERGLCVEFDDGNAAFPLAKVRKQFANGVDGGDGIYDFYATIPVLFRLSPPRG
jgi:hypothetical protein